MSKKVKLDTVDRHILHDLQSDGRITNVELAKNAGIFGAALPQAGTDA